MITRIFCFFLLIFLISSCSDLFEKDISDKKIVIFAPTNSMVTKFRDILFIWNEDADIKQFNVQIVSPDFKMIQNVMVDSTLKGSRFLFKNADIGNYSLRIVGYNGQSKCYSDTLNFTIEKDQTSQSFKREE